MLGGDLPHQPERDRVKKHNKAHVNTIKNCLDAITMPDLQNSSKGDFNPDTGAVSGVGAVARAHGWDPSVTAVGARGYLQGNTNYSDDLLNDINDATDSVPNDGDRFDSLMSFLSQASADAENPDGDATGTTDTTGTSSVRGESSTRTTQKI